MALYKFLTIATLGFICIFSSKDGMSSSDNLQEKEQWKTTIKENYFKAVPFQDVKLEETLEWFSLKRQRQVIGQLLLATDCINKLPREEAAKFMSAIRTEDDNEALKFFFMWIRKLTPDASSEETLSSILKTKNQISQFIQEYSQTHSVSENQKNSLFQQLANPFSEINFEKLDFVLAMNPVYWNSRILSFVRDDNCELLVKIYKERICFLSSISCDDHKKWQEKVSLVEAIFPTHSDLTSSLTIYMEGICNVPLSQLSWLQSNQKIFDHPMEEKKRIWPHYASNVWRAWASIPIFRQSWVLKQKKIYENLDDEQKAIVIAILGHSICEKKFTHACQEVGYSLKTSLQDPPQWSGPSPGSLEFDWRSFEQKEFINIWRLLAEMDLSSLVKLKEILKVMSVMMPEKPIKEQMRDLADACLESVCIDNTKYTHTYTSLGFGFFPYFINKLNDSLRDSPIILDDNAFTLWYEKLNACKALCMDEKYDLKRFYLWISRLKKEKSSNYSLSFLQESIFAPTSRSSDDLPSLNPEKSRYKVGKLGITDSFELQSRQRENTQIIHRAPLCTDEEVFVNEILKIRGLFNAEETTTINGLLSGLQKYIQRFKNYSSDDSKSNENLFNWFPEHILRGSINLCYIPYPFLLFKELVFNAAGRQLELVETIKKKVYKSNSSSPPNHANLTLALYNHFIARAKEKIAEEQVD